MIIAAFQLRSMDTMGSLGVGYDELPHAPATPLETSTSLNDAVRDGGRLLAQENPLTSIGGPKNAFERGSRRLDNTRSWTVFQLLNYMIGSGILNAAQAFRESGIAAAIVLYIIVALANCFGDVVLVSSAETLTLEKSGEEEETRNRQGHSGAATEELEYTFVAKHTLGAWGGKAADGFIILQNFGSCISYLIIIGELTTSLISEWIDTETLGATGKLWRSSYFLVPLIVLLFVLPPSLVRHFSNLRWLAVYSLMTISVVVILVVIGGPVYADRERSSPHHDPALDAPIIWWSWLGMLRKFGSVVFSLTCAAAVLHGHSSMAVRTEREFFVAISQAKVIGWALCCMTGVVGYLSFRDAVEGDILGNFSGALASCFKIFVLIHLVLFIPNEIVILRHSLFAFLGKDVMDASFCTVAAVTMEVLSALVGIVVGLKLTGKTEGDLFGYVLDLTGAFFSSVLNILLPTLIYLQATRGITGNRRVKWYRRGCYVAMAVAIWAIVTVPIAVAVDIMGYD